MFGLIGKSILTVCAFFGHRDTPATDEIEKKVEETARSLIAQGVNEFWICNEGNFDWISRMVVSRLKEEFKNYIYVCYISAYNPSKFSKPRREWLEERYELDYPYEAANGYPKFAIERRNKYIADNADYIICFILEKSGGAYKAVKRAEKNGKTIINIAEMIDKRFL